MKKNCLTCKWEPEWSKWVGVEYKRCVGDCRCPVKSQLLPAVYTLSKQGVTRYSDDSGLPTFCHTWEAKT
jgi:hypothetical protein